MMSVNVGWEGGVHVQTCGHHLHLDCLKSYLSSLRSQQRLAADRGEYACPLCRQLANSVLPLLPPPISSLGLTPPPNATDPELLAGVNTMLRTALPPPTQNVTSLMEAMSKSVEDMTNVTYAKYRQKIGGSRQQGNTNQLVFIMSIARTNLEIEVAQRGGTLITPLHPSVTQDMPSSSTSGLQPTNILVPKRSAISALLRVLGVQAKLNLNPLWDVCCSGLFSQDFSSSSVANNVPLLLVDPSTLLTQLILLLPLNLDIAYFTRVVKILYNLLYFQVVVQLSYKLTPAERIQCTSQDGETELLEQAFAFVIRTLEGTGVYCEVEEVSSNCTCSSSSNSGCLKQAEAQLRTLCLPFLRIAALLRHHLYSLPLPEIDDPEQEFLRLIYYLELVREGMSIHRFNGGSSVTFPWRPTVEPWLRQLGDFISRSQMSSRSLIQEHHILWNQPRLLSLPDLYDKIFQYYHRRQCTQCHSIPRETSICLLCGTLVCLKESCCKQLSICEAVQHSIDCGAGTAMYLVVTSSYIIVIRGKRACLWGSVYLDSFGEEDRELKRGKPLYLSASRYELLQQQWLAHRFDHMNKKWVWHRDAL
uniref:E3 ubiquitin-protein ligase n=1 Tax=Gerris buenoi TaxID=56086 RepID=A0A3G6IGR8_GERBU|nr:E3 ubiquitin-protein ligase [Gerris buenoi]